jgi:hypothetical protein
VWRETRLNNGLEFKSLLWCREYIERENIWKEEGNKREARENVKVRMSTTTAGTTTLASRERRMM